ncbi:MAG TPA: hypothetical protein DDX91_00715 [Ruminococcaceae bacterium]|nr:hypothetical protein [Oscillospiraceae bacterium]
MEYFQNSEKIRENKRKTEGNLKKSREKKKRTEYAETEKTAKAGFPRREGLTKRAACRVPFCPGDFLRFSEIRTGSKKRLKRMCRKGCDLLSTSYTQF